jgi:hypothetical protein
MTWPGVIEDSLLAIELLFVLTRSRNTVEWGLCGGASLPESNSSLLVAEPPIVSGRKQNMWEGINY